MVSLQIAVASTGQDISVTIVSQKPHTIINCINPLRRYKDKPTTYPPSLLRVIKVIIYEWHVEWSIMKLWCQWRWRPDEFQAVPQEGWGRRARVGYAKVVKGSEIKVAVSCAEEFQRACMEDDLAAGNSSSQSNQFWIIFIVIVIIFMALLMASRRNSSGHRPWLPDEF